jgi:hypothetical protein
VCTFHVGALLSFKETRQKLFEKEKDNSNSDTKQCEKGTIQKVVVKGTITLFAVK